LSNATSFTTTHYSGYHHLMSQLELQKYMQYGNNFPNNNNYAIASRKIFKEKLNTT
jgi:hypothetical protein